MHDNCCLDLEVKISDEMPDVQLFSGLYHPSETESSSYGEKNKKALISSVVFEET